MPSFKVSADNAIDVCARYMIRDVWPLVPDFEKSSGNRLHDAASGKSYLDCFGHLASNPLGHNHPGLDQPEFVRKLLRVAKTKPSLSDFYPVEMAEFVATFGEIAIPSELQHLFLIEGGAAAVENALKAAFDWKVRLNFSRGAKHEMGTKIIHFTGAFHGRNGYTLSLTNSVDPRKTKFYPKFDWPRIPAPQVRFPLEGAQLQLAEDSERQALSEIEGVLKTSAREVAAIIIEPIQGEGGDNHFRESFLVGLRSLADAYDVLLIFDEIQSGAGITGKMWAYQHFAVHPDILCFGKKMQVCGILAGPRIDQVRDNVFVEPSRINSTWGGNLVDLVRAQRYLEIIRDDKLVENSASVGAYLVGHLQQLCKTFPDLLSNPRGRGLMCAIDLPSPELRNAVQDAALELGLLLPVCGSRTIRFRPALTFSRLEVDELANLLQDVVKRVKQSMS